MGMQEELVVLWYAINNIHARIFPKFLIIEEIPLIHAKYLGYKRKKKLLKKKVEREQRRKEREEETRMIYRW